MDVRAVELAAAAEDVPVLKIEPRPHLFKGGQVQIYGPCSDGAAAGHGYAASPSRASSGPSTSTEARMVLTSS